MSAHFRLTQTAIDSKRYMTEYLPVVMSFIVKHKEKVIVADFEATPLQGAPASGLALLKFPTETNIKDFQSNPKYQPIKELRLAITTQANAVMAPEYQTPAHTRQMLRY